MLALPEISINVLFLAFIVIGAAALGFLLNSARINKQRAAVLKLESEMLQSHAEILQLQKDLSERENLHSKTPIFSIRDTAPESINEQTPGTRLSKKMAAGRGKSTS
jgi:hypothetical protein